MNIERIVPFTDELGTQPYRLRPLTLSLIPLCLLILTFLIGCGSGSSAETEDASGMEATQGAEAGPPERTALVKTEDVIRREWQETVELTAELLPWASVTVSAEAAGRVVHLPVEHGDKVKEGQVLARLKTDSTEAQEAQASARVKSAQAGLAQAERDLERGRALADADQGIVSENDVDRWVLAYETRAAELAEAEAALRVVAEQLRDMEIRAPFSGVISERVVEKGSWVSPGDPIMRVVARDRLKARASVSAKDRMRLGLEQEAFFRSEVSDGNTYTAELRFLGQEADSNTATFLVEAEVDPSTGTDTLLPGLQGILTVVLVTRDGILIPRTAVLSSSTEQYVFVTKDGKAERRTVELEVVDGRRARVISGVEAGDRLVIQGQHRVADGQEVTEELG